jgi:FtsP/CotA-like multicopper oxidase with cupredoxin domain
VNKPLKIESVSPESVAESLTRRQALLGAAVAAGGLAVPGLARAQTTRDAQPLTGNAPATRGGEDFSKYLRDTRNDPWRQKMDPRSPLAEAYENIYRIDPDNPLPPGRPGEDYMPVVTPNNTSLPFKIVDGVKVFHLVAEETVHHFDPDLRTYCWGYNGVTNGPTIEAVEGDRVRIYVTNKLPAPTTVHWHGFVLPHGMDGISGLEQPAILPGETFMYEYTIRQHGTFMYHSHHDTMTQEGMGMVGMYIVHPRKELHPEMADRPTVERDFAIMLQTWWVDIGASRPNPFSMMFNLFTMNAHVFPDTEPLIARANQRVRIRIGNLSAVHHHPIHLHGYEFVTTARDGHSLPPEDQQVRVTQLVGVGQTRDIELVTTEEGDWIFHCHMTHHIMNQMGDFTNTVGMAPGELDEHLQRLLPGYMTMGNAGMNDRTGKPMMPVPPNSIPMKKGDGPYGPISVAGMANLLKVRNDISDEMLATNTDPGQYTSPLDKLALPARPEALRRDGINM